MPKNEDNNNKGQQRNEKQKDNAVRAGSQGNSGNNKQGYYGYHSKKNKRSKARSNNNNVKQRYNKPTRAEETIEDIKNDISRIEKEIQLELKEIRSLKFGF